MEKEITFYGFLLKLRKDVFGSIGNLFTADKSTDVDDKINFNVLSPSDQKIIKEALSEVEKETEKFNLQKTPLKEKKDFKIPKTQVENVPQKTPENLENQKKEIDKELTK